MICGLCLRRILDATGTACRNSRGRPRMAACGGMYNDNSSPAAADCAFSRNSAGFGAGIYGSGDVTLTNCILWGDTPDEVQVSAGMVSAGYSNIQSGFEGEEREGNIDADRLFADPDNGDYRLKSQAGRWELASQSSVKDDVTSPCIDAGDSGSDWAAEVWPHGRRINMGAYDGTAQASMSPSTIGNAGDCNNDAAIDARDLLALAERWLTGGTPAAGDINRDGSVNFLACARLVQDWLRQEP